MTALWEKLEVFQLSLVFFFGIFRCSSYVDYKMCMHSLKCHFGFVRLEICEKSWLVCAWLKKYGVEKTIWRRSAVFFFHCFNRRPTKKHLIWQTRGHCGNFLHKLILKLCNYFIVVSMIVYILTISIIIDRIKCVINHRNIYLWCHNLLFILRVNIFNFFFQNI